MPLDKVLIDHLDDQDELEKKIDEEIDSLIGTLTPQDLMNGSEDALMSIVEALQERLKAFYYNEATLNGIRLAQAIEEDGDIQIPKTTDGDLNEGLLDDDQGES